MRIVFAGTPRFAAVALEALLAASHEVALVLTQPDRPSGRGMRLVPSEVKQAALAAGLPVWQPASLRDDGAAARLAGTGAAVMVVAAYGLILPPPVLSAFPLGCVNIHASMLPRWRGAAPIHRAILAGDTRTGVCIMQMEAGLDTGPVLLSAGEDILPSDTTGSLHNRLARLGADLVVRALPELASGALRPLAQDHAGATYAAKISRDEAVMDFLQPAAALERRVRALDPAPGAVARLAGEAVKVWRAEGAGPAAGAPGTIVSADRHGVLVACGDGEALRLLELQRPGGRRLTAAAFLQGFPLSPGTLAGTGPAVHA